MSNRRSFIQKIGMASLAFPYFSQASIKTGLKKQYPVIICSRGEYWGRKVLEPGWKILNDNGSLLDAIESSSMVTELDPEDQSVGYGGLPNEQGIVQLDASFMDGKTHNCGSVAALENIKTPSAVARLVMERTDHIHLVGQGALDFAKMHGFKEENLLTEKSRLRWLKWKENLSDNDDYLPPADNKYEEEDRPTGTINVLGIDKNGDLAGCTTTSGLFGKIPGRIGDSPIIGAGLYVDNEVGAAGATGRGEEILRTCGSFFVVEQMRNGKTPQEACEALCKRIIDINGGKEKVDFNDKIIAVNKNGEVGCAMIRGNKDYTPKLSYWNENGFSVYEGTYLIETK